MSTIDFVTELFCRIDDTLKDVAKHPLAHLYPSELVTIACLFAIKGVGNRQFYRWLDRDLRPLFPRLPERTRLFRLLKAHQALAARFLASPTLLGVIDSCGIELLHPWRYGRTAQQIGKKGFSNHRWIVGGKLCFVLNRLGLVVAWDCSTANTADQHFLPLVDALENQMVVLADAGFQGKQIEHANLLVCPRGHWNQRMLIETVLSMLTRVCQLKRQAHRVWRYFQARLAYTMAAFNLLASWQGLLPQPDGFVPLSIAQFSL